MSLGVVRSHVTLILYRVPPSVAPLRKMVMGLGFPALLLALTCSVGLAQGEKIER